jgi:hypothetical protein
MKFISFNNWINENKKDNIIILLPGSFKPMTAAHVQLIKRYLYHPDVKEVKVLIGAGTRNGITQKESKQIATLLLKNLDKLSIETSLYPSPILTAYKYIETAKPGIYAMAGSKKGEDYNRIEKFVKEHQPGGKYFHTKPPNVNVIELFIDVNPLLYKGRTDEYEGEPISASILRQDILNDDYNNFRTNYPEYDEKIIRKIWDETQIIITESLKLFEGGNVFEGTGPIAKEFIEPTLNRFKNKLNKIFPNVKFDFELLGSAGKKSISGDIDLALSEKTIFDENDNVKYEDWNINPNDFEIIYEQIRKRVRNATEKQSKLRAAIKMIATQLLDDNEISTDVKNSTAGTLFCSFPQYNEKGSKVGKGVQIDINIGDLNWLRFSYHSETYESNVKGLHRTQLIVALFANKKRTFRHGTGVVNTQTGEYEAISPEDAIDLLNKLYNFKTNKLNKDIIGNFFKLHAFLIKNLSIQELHNVYDIYLRILDSTRTDIPEDIQPYWIENQKRLGLKGLFLPEDSNLYKYKQ